MERERFVAVTDRLTILTGDWIERLRELPDESVQTCVTSPAYWNLRDYKMTGQCGREATPELYVAKLVEGFREVKRILRNNGTLWLNLGDSYAASSCGGNPSNSLHQKQRTNLGSEEFVKSKRLPRGTGRWGGGNSHVANLKPKDLIGIPWLVAFALRADGWYLRCDIVWAKRNCMPESVTDRPTRSHEFIFLLSKSQKYFYDHEAIKEPCIYDVNGTGTAARKARAEGNKLLPTDKVNGIRPGGYKNSVNFDGKNKGKEKQRGHGRRHGGFNARWDSKHAEEDNHHEQNQRRLESGAFSNNKSDRPEIGMRNKRDVWTVAPANYPEAHFATFPPDLIKPCILAGSKPGDVVLDPFGGSGTTGQVALELGRKAILIELNPEYIELIKSRCNVTPGLALA